MNICVTVNSKYVRYLYVMLQSLYGNNEKGSINLYVLQRDFTESDKAVITEISERFQNKVFYIFVREPDLSEMPEYIGGRNDLPSEIICFRLMLPEMLPDTLDRVLMLDVDLVINKDVTELYNTDFEGKVLAAAPNMCHNYVVDVNWRKWYPQDRSDWTHYNTGVLMWNLDKIRKSYPPYYLLRQACIQQIEVGTFEEELFNVVFGENLIKEISAEKWNYIITHQDMFERPRFRKYQSVQEIKADCGIVHYAALNPWAEGAQCEKFSLWWEYAKKTPFYHGFTEEHLERQERYLAGKERLIEKLENTLCAERKVIFIYDIIYRLKGSGKPAKYFRMYDGGFYFYGAGMVADKFYDLLADEGTEGVIKGVFDQKKTGVFHGILVCSEVRTGIRSLDEHDWLIVTPTLTGEEIAEEIKEYADVNVILLPELLTNMLNIKE